MLALFSTGCLFKLRYMSGSDLRFYALVDVHEYSVYYRSSNRVPAAAEQGRTIIATASKPSISIIIASMIAYMGILPIEPVCHTVMVKRQGNNQHILNAYMGCMLKMDLTQQNSILQSEYRRAHFVFNTTLERFIL